jgi:heme-degrading monooxygenase HmoA
MFMRISWGRLNPGAWDAYEKSFTEAVDAAGQPGGLVARVLCRDIDDGDTGYSLTSWESREDMEAYEDSNAVHGEILPRIEQHFAGAFVTNRLEVVLDRRYDEQTVGVPPAGV